MVVEMARHLVAITERYLPRHHARARLEHLGTAWMKNAAGGAAGGAGHIAGQRDARSGAPAWMRGTAASSAEV